MQTERQAERFDIAVVGGGIVGLLAACALATTGLRIVLVAPEPAEADGRTTALLDDAVRDLVALEAWEACAPHAAPLRTMRIMDGTGRLLRARPLDFSASELGLPAFGYNVPNQRLTQALREILPRAGVQHHAATVAAADDRLGRLDLSDGGAVEARLLVAADGRRSVLRQAAGIGVRAWSYDQVALVLPFRHTEPHAGVSAEIHTESGPFTQVPLPPRDGAPYRSSLVWVVRRDAAPALAASPLESLARTIEDRFQGAWGEVTVEQEPATFPLEGQIAHVAGKGRTVLVGEAAHVFPPIGAQGANLGFRDVRALVRCVRSTPLDAVPRRYALARAADIALRAAGVDALNRSLLSDLLPVQAGRLVAMEALARSGSLRRAIMRAGLASAQTRGNGSTGSAPVVIR